MEDKSKGTVRWFNNSKGYGFIIQAEGGDDVFVHYSVIEGKGYRSFVEGEEVEFEYRKTEKGLQATFARSLNPRPQVKKRAQQQPDVVQ